MKILLKMSSVNGGHFVSASMCDQCKMMIYELIWQMVRCLVIIHEHVRWTLPDDVTKWNAFRITRLLALCEGIHRSSADFTHRGPVTRCIGLNNLLNSMICKCSETPQRSYDVTVMDVAKPAFCGKFSWFPIPTTTRGHSSMKNSGI